MLQQTADVRQSQAARKQRAAALGPTVARLCRALEKGDVIAIACSEQRGEAIAKAVASLSPARVLWCPPSDALPGEEAPSSPRIAGHRVAALSALQNRDGRRSCSSDAAFGRSESRSSHAFRRAEPLAIQNGQQLDGDAFAETLEPLGYFRDDRVGRTGRVRVSRRCDRSFPIGRGAAGPNPPRRRTRGEDRALRPGDAARDE
jgi:transcription-repair coupling factor (superfamily II helicase)